MINTRRFLVATSSIGPVKVTVTLTVFLTVILTGLFTLIRGPQPAAAGPLVDFPSLPLAGSPHQTYATLPTTSTVVALQEQKARFDRVSTADGLSFFNVRPILQDQRGFMWIGTYGAGLNKYDGYQFTVYRHDPDDPSTLSQDIVHALCEDRNGNLWIGTENGLDRLPLAEAKGLDQVAKEPDQVAKEPGQVAKEPGQVAKEPGQETQTFAHYLEGQGPVLSIYEDSVGTLWVGTVQELIDFDPTAEKVNRSFRPDPDAVDGSPTLSGYAVWTIYEDQSDRLWIGTDGGLDQFDRTTGTFTHYRHDPDDPSSLSGYDVYALHQDRQGYLWIGTYGGGLNRLDPSSGTIVHYQHNPDRPHSLGNDRVTSLFEDSDGDLWIGTTDGLDRLAPSDGAGLDPDQTRFHHYRHDSNDSRSLSSDLIWSIQEDRSNVMWIGTSEGGVSRYNRRANQFTHFTAVLSDDKVLALHQDRSGTLWIGTLNGGLNRLDRRSGRLTVYRHDPADPDSLSSNSVHAVYEDRSGVLWVGASGWLERFDPQTGTFAHQRYVGPAIEKLAEDQSGRLWIGTSNGLYRLDPASGDFASYHPDPDDPHSLSHPDIQTIHVDQAGSVWIGTLAGGIDVWDPVSARFSHYRHDPEDPGSVSSDGIAGINEDATGTIWIGTMGGGLNRFDRDTQTFTRYRESDGLPGDSAGCILPDSAGYLWLRTITGVSQFDPRTETFRNYDERDGVLNGGLTPLTCFRSRTGEMFFSGIDGFYTFQPENVKNNPHVPPVVITTFYLYNQPLYHDLHLDQHIELSHQDNYISFEFAALDYTIPEKNQYAYMMEGLDEGWVYAGTRRHVDYPNLQPGDYVFRVKGSNNDGVWNEQGTWARITIAPPLWERWWLRATAVLLLLFSVLVGYRLQVRSIEARSQELESQVQERTTELRREIDQRLQVEEALQQSELDKAITDERSRLARELHDAVTQSLFSASLIAEALPDSWARDQESGRQLLKEIRLLTRGALAEMRTLLLELRPASLIEAKLADLLQQLAEAATGREGLPITVTVEGECDLPPDTHIALYRIAQEALNNVLKHARAERAEIVLRCTPSAGGRDAGETVELRICDDGRGFNPTTVSSDHLGLNIMQERAGAIGAALTIESRPGDGTQIRVVWEEEQ